MLTAERSLTDMDGYLSPEQANGRPLDGRSDIFSLRVVMYDALSGRHANLVCTRSGSSEPAKRGREGETRRGTEGRAGCSPSREHTPPILIPARVSMYFVAASM